MGLSVNQGMPPQDRPVVAPPGALVVDRRLYWNADRTRLVEEADPESAFLAYTAGTVIPEHLVNQMGLAERGLSVEPAEPAEPAEKVQSRRRRRGDRDVAPGVVTDTSIDGEAHVLVAEPGSPLRNGADK